MDLKANEHSPFSLTRKVVLWLAPSCMGPVQDHRGLDPSGEAHCLANAIQSNSCDRKTAYCEACKGMRAHGLLIL